jgi:hypothetical protein
VDAADCAILRANFGKTGMWWMQGDFNHDGTIDASDLATKGKDKTVGMTFASGQVYVLPKKLDEKVARLHLKKVGICKTLDAPAGLSPEGQPRPANTAQLGKTRRTDLVVLRGEFPQPLAGAGRLTFNANGSLRSIAVGQTLRFPRPDGTPGQAIAIDFGAPLAIRTSTLSAMA